MTANKTHGDQYPHQVLLIIPKQGEQYDPSTSIETDQLLMVDTSNDFMEELYSRSTGRRIGIVFVPEPLMIVHQQTMGIDEKYHQALANNGYFVETCIVNKKGLDRIKEQQKIDPAWTLMIWTTDHQNILLQIQ